MDPLPTARVTLVFGAFVRNWEGRKYSGVWWSRDQSMREPFFPCPFREVPSPAPALKKTNLRKKMFSPEQSRWPPTILYCWQNSSSYSCKLKVSRKNQCQKIFVRKSLCFVITPNSKIEEKVTKSFAWGRISAVQRSTTWSRASRKFKLLFPQGVREFWSTWHVLLQTENVFRLGLV